MPGHPEIGEEAFLVRRAGDGVFFAVTAFSRPARWYVRPAGPVTRAVQAGYARWPGRALRRICAGQ